MGKTSTTDYPELYDNLKNCLSYWIAEVKWYIETEEITEVLIAMNFSCLFKINDRWSDCQFYISLLLGHNSPDIWSNIILDVSMCFFVL